MTNKDTFRTGTPDGEPLLNNKRMTNKDMPDETMQERLQSIFDTDMLRYVDDEGNAENVISLEAALTSADEIIDELNAKHEADIREHAIKFFYWWHNQPGNNTEQGYESFLEYLKQ